MTPKQFVEKYIGKVIDYDKTYGPQCVDAFKQFCADVGVPVRATPNNWADGYWYSKDALGYGNYFTYILNPGEFTNGDWVIWAYGSKSHPSSHIALYYNGQEFSENQGGNKGFTLKDTVFSDALGALRWRGWGDIAYGMSVHMINGRSYILYRQNTNEEAVVISAGLNQLKSIHELDVKDRYVMCKASGGNFFQMKTDQPDPYGTTYGDISAPLSEVWRELPNQDTTLYFDMETGSYGDSTGVHIDQTHNVFSPSIVYPKEGNYQYARMVGASAVNNVSTYSFVIRLKDGTFVLGIAKSELTPKTIATDFRNYDIESISFLDGGGSAQFAGWDGKSFTYYRDTGREVPSAIAIISKSIPQEEEREEEKMEEKEQTKEQTTTEPIENWTDPEPKDSLIVQRIAALMSVKSLITIALTVAFIFLVINEKQLPDEFTSVYTMCISFFFGYQFKKAENKE